MVEATKIMLKADIFCGGHIKKRKKGRTGMLE
jgi:hypothetical protein